MPMPQSRPNRQRSRLISPSRSRRSRQKQVSHLRHSRDHHNSLKPLLPASTDDRRRSLHGLRILYRRAAKLHHNKLLSHYTQADTATALAETAFTGTPNLSSFPSNASTSA